AVYDFDRGGRGDRDDSQCAAVEDLYFFAGGEWRVAADCGDFYFAAGEPERFDGGAHEYGDVQCGGVDHGGGDDCADVCAGGTGDLSVGAWGAGVRGWG